ncbi:hypothetical protein R4036_004598 [Salmonella enterica]|nr:hypothetical protein [Salmonella enterica]
MKEYKLDDLLAGITPENRHELLDFGKPVGNEIGSLDNAESVERELLDSLAFNYAVYVDSSSYKDVGNNMIQFTVCKDGKELECVIKFPVDRRTVNLATASLFNQWCE